MLAKTILRWPNAMQLWISAQKWLKVISQLYRIALQIQKQRKNFSGYTFSASVPCAPWVPDGEDKAKSLEAFKTKLDKFIPNIEKILEENGGEWMVGDGFTWADLYVAYVLDQVKHVIIIMCCIKARGW